MGALLSLIEKEEEDGLWFWDAYHREYRWRWGGKMWRYTELREDNPSTSEIESSWVWQTVDTDDVWHGCVHPPDIMWRIQQQAAADERRRRHIHHLLLIMGRRYPPHIIEKMGLYLL